MSGFTFSQSYNIVAKLKKKKGSIDIYFFYKTTFAYRSAALVFPAKLNVGRTNLHLCKK